MLNFYYILFSYQNVSNFCQILKEIAGEHEARKSKYDQINAGYESNRSQLEQVNI